MRRVSKMNENELRALISLLDDDDPGVKEQVEAELLALGETVIPRLEQAWAAAARFCHWLSSSKLVVP